MPSPQLPFGHRLERRFGNELARCSALLAQNDYAALERALDELERSAPPSEPQLAGWIAVIAGTRVLDDPMPVRQRIERALRAFDHALGHAGGDALADALDAPVFQAFARACSPSERAHLDHGIGALLRRHPPVARDFALLERARSVLDLRKERPTEFSHGVASLLHELDQPHVIRRLRDLLLRLQGLLPESDAAHGWDWADPAWYSTRGGLPYPFDNRNNVGVDITTDRCRPEDGWELYIRRVMATDGESVQGDTCMTPSQSTKMFALYNRRYGLLRVFVYQAQPNVNSGDAFHVRASVMVGESTVLATQALLNLCGARALTVDDSVDPAKGGCVEVEHVADYIVNGWLVLDYPLSYDGGDTGREHEPLYLSVKLFSVDKAKITLSGTFEATSKKTIGRDATISSGLATVWDNRRFATQGKADVTSFANELEEQGRSLIDEGFEAVGAGLVSLGGGILSAATPVGALVGAGQLIYKLIGLGNAGVEYSYQEGTMELGGAIDNSAVEGSTALLLAESNEVPVIEIPYLFKRDPRAELGLFNVNRLPKVEVRWTQISNNLGGTLTFSASVAISGDIRDEVVVNPQTGTTLVGVQIKPVLRRLAVVQQPFAAWEVLGAGVTYVPDPGDPGILEYFIPEMRDPLSYASPQAFITNGKVNSQSLPDGTWNEMICIGAALKVRFVFERPGSGTAESRRFETVVTYPVHPEVRETS